MNANKSRLCIVLIKRTSGSKFHFMNAILVSEIRLNKLYRSDLFGDMKQHFKQISRNGINEQKQRKE